MLTKNLTSYILLRLHTTPADIDMAPKAQKNVSVTIDNIEGYVPVLALYHVNSQTPNVLCSTPCKPLFSYSETERYTFNFTIINIAESTSYADLMFNYTVMYIRKDFV